MVNNFITLFEMDAWVEHVPATNQFQSSWYARISAHKSPVFMENIQV